MDDFSVIVYKSRLINARKEKNLSQKQLADLLHVQRTTYSTWEQENKSSFPNIETLFRICRLLDVSSDFLVGLSDDPCPASVFRLKSASIPRDPYADLSPASRAILDSVAKTLRDQDDADGMEAKKGS